MDCGKIMQKLSCPKGAMHVVCQHLDRMMARFSDNRTVSEAFAVTNGVKQGCVLAPTLFSLMFSAVLMDAYHDEPPGIRIAYSTDGHLLISRHMQDLAITVQDLDFADDCSLNTTTNTQHGQNSGHALIVTLHRRAF
ncbi:unnamed protein product [Schistocephalus solidus]|uniref:Reverse transcriptase domain-containing protein n=1 Tax=Schistocephalus solidus TaxID=70667 RepID=A0A183T0P1_SCHSO|nr:unnamed protein product [Schistocephalus solidus]